MSSNDPNPSRIIGGGINTSDAREPVVVTQMLGVDNSGPIREETLRARFLSFDPLFDAESRLVAHQLVLRGPTATPDAPPELRQMDEDMLLTGLYSLAQDSLTGELPLLVQISADTLFSDLLQQVAQIDGLRRLRFVSFSLLILGFINFFQGCIKWQPVPLNGSTTQRVLVSSLRTMVAMICSRTSPRSSPRASSPCRKVRR